MPQEKQIIEQRFLIIDSRPDIFVKCKCLFCKGVDASYKCGNYSYFPSINKWSPTSNFVSKLKLEEVFDNLPHKARDFIIFHMNYFL